MGCFSDLNRCKFIFDLSETQYMFFVVYSKNSTNYMPVSIETYEFSK